MPHSTRKRLRRERRERRQQQALQQAQGEGHQALQQEDHQALQQKDRQALHQEDKEEGEQEGLSIRFTRVFATNTVEFKHQRGPMPCRAIQLLDVNCLKELSSWGVSYYDRLPDSLACNEDLVKTLLKKHGTNILSRIMWRYKHYDPVSEVGKLLVVLAAENPASMDEFYKSNKAFILDVIKLNAFAFKYSHHELMSDVDFVLACMVENIKVGQYANSALFKSLTTKEDVKTTIDARAYATSKEALEDAGSQQESNDDDYDDEYYGDYCSSEPQDGYPDDDYKGCGGYGWNGWAES